MLAWVGEERGSHGLLRELLRVRGGGWARMGRGCEVGWGLRNTLVQTQLGLHIVDKLYLVKAHPKPRDSPLYPSYLNLLAPSWGQAFSDLPMKCGPMWG